MKQIRRNISLDLATNRALIELANSQHKSVSQWITDCVWERTNDISRKEDITAVPIIAKVHHDNGNFA